MTLRVRPRALFEVAVAACAAGLGFGLVAVIAARGPDRGDTLAAKWRSSFARPATIPSPAGNPLTAAKVELGRRLFLDPSLSLDGTVACATCHDPKLGFANGAPLGTGIGGQATLRHVPALWNLAWSRSFMWDGRAHSLETQALLPMEDPREMGETLGGVTDKLEARAELREVFAAAFPEEPGVSGDSVLKALASYARTVASEETRFDAWLDGAPGALTPEEVRGFELFVGKARCVECHSGHAFTDHGFHDVGLPGDDLGRGPVIGVAAVDRAFKTPTLRELAWTSPYMHDGSLATLDDVVEHYSEHRVERPTLARELQSKLGLTAQEKSDLVAFLGALSSSDPPRPSTALIATTLGRANIPEPEPAPVGTTVISQRGKAFAPGFVVFERGNVLTVLNDDTRTHNVRSDQPGFAFNSGAQEPGETVRIPLPLSGVFEAYCGIHPAMRLKIEVR